MNEDRMNEGGVDEQAGPLWPRWPDREPRQGVWVGVWVGVAIQAALIVTLALVDDLHRHLDAEERAAAVPARPNFGMMR